MDWTRKQQRASAKGINLIVCSVVQFQFDGMYEFLRGSGNQRKCHFWTWTMHLQVECEFRFFYRKNNNNYYYYYSQTLLVGGHTNCHTQRNAFIRWSVGSSLVVSKSAPPSSCPVPVHPPSISVSICLFLWGCRKQKCNRKNWPTIHITIRSHSGSS